MNESLLSSAPLPPTHPRPSPLTDPRPASPLRTAPQALALLRRRLKRALGAYERYKHEYYLIVYEAIETEDILLSRATGRSTGDRRFRSTLNAPRTGPRAAMYDQAEWWWKARAAALIVFFPLCSALLCDRVPHVRGPLSADVDALLCLTIAHASPLVPPPPTPAVHHPSAVAEDPRADDGLSDHRYSLRRGDDVVRSPSSSRFPSCSRHALYVDSTALDISSSNAAEKSAVRSLLV